MNPISIPRVIQKSLMRMNSLVRQIIKRNLKMIIRYLKNKMRIKKKLKKFNKIKFQNNRIKFQKNMKIKSIK